MGERRKSRELLLQLLFQEEMNTEKDRTLLLKNFWKDFAVNSTIAEWAENHYCEISDRKAQLDNIIERYSENWKLSRMSAVDRNILRVATYELCYGKEAPGEIVLNEAIELAKRFGNEDSGAFVNGILDKIFNETCRS